MEFKKELEHLINRHGVDNEISTPDFILADYLVHCIYLFSNSMANNIKWHGYSKQFSEGARGPHSGTSKDLEFGGGISKAEILGRLRHLLRNWDEYEFHSVVIKDILKCTSPNSKHDESSGITD